MASGTALARTTTHGCLSIADPDLQADHMEVTQSVQDGHNEVGLIAGKRTFVRLYGHAIAERGACLTGAHLVVRRGETSVTLAPLNMGGRSLLWSFRVDGFRRSLESTGFLFEIPVGFRTGTVNLLGRVNPEDDPAETRRGNNQVAAEITFREAAIPDVTVYRVSYSLGTTAYSTGLLHADQAMRWLRKVYPVARVGWTSPVLAWGAGTTGLDDDGNTVLTRPSCGRLNSRLLRILPWTTVPEASQWYAQRGITTVNRWVAMVTDQGAFMRGCSADIPTLVASGPTGTGTYGWDTDGSYGDWYTGHELGHTYGRRHAPFCEAEGDRADYPYRDGYIGSWDVEDRERVVGFDSLTEDVYSYLQWKDFMTYCRRQWVSDFTYNALMRFFTAFAPARLSALRVAQDPIPLPSLVVVGSIDPRTDETELDPVFALPPGSGSSPPGQGRYAIVLRSADGTELARYPFEPGHEHSGAPAPGVQQAQEIERLRVAEVVRAMPGTRSVELVGPNGKVLAVRRPGASPPKVELVSPKAGEVVGSSVHVQWQASDPDNDPLSYLLLYSPDGGQTWTPASLETDSTSVEVSRESLTAGAQALFRVVASDGLNTSVDDSDATFVVPDAPAQVEIVAPNDNKIVLSDATLGLEAAAYDVDRGALDGKDVEWHSSIDGLLGEGAQLSVTGLSEGEHQIAVFAGGGQQPAFDSISVIVVKELPQPPDEIVVEPSPLVLFSTGNTDAALVVFDRNAKRLAWSAKPSEPWIRLDRLTGDEPAQITVSVDRAKLSHPVKAPLKGQIVFTSSDLPGRQWVVEVELDP